MTSNNQEYQLKISNLLVKSLENLIKVLENDGDAIGVFCDKTKMYWDHYQKLLTAAKEVREMYSVDQDNKGIA